MFPYARILILFCSLSIVNKSFSQDLKDTIVLLNGDALICTVIDTTNGVTSIKNPKNPKKNVVIENNRIFSIRNPKGESIMYVYDTLIGNEFTVDEMRYFIYGEADADKNFKASGSLLLGTAIGAMSGFTGLFFCPIPPFAFTALTGLPKVRIKHESVSNLEFLKHDPYIMGYERVARKKRKIKSLLGGGVGLVVGLGAYGTLKATDNDPWKR